MDIEEIKSIIGVDNAVIDEDGNFCTIEKLVNITAQNGLEEPSILAVKVWALDVRFSMKLPRIIHSNKFHLLTQSNEQARGE